MPFQRSTCILFTVACLHAAEFYVAPDGSGVGDGSAAAPWDLNTALRHPPAVQPGDVLWLKGGTYAGLFTSNLNGTPEAPIIVRQIPGERVVIDGQSQAPFPAVLTIRGVNTWFWGLEVMNSSSNRDLGPAPAGRATGIDIFGSGARLINCIVHDNGNGIGFWSNSSDSLIYGAIVYNNGWDAEDRGHGHAVYAQNRTGTKHITDSAFFNSYSHGLHIYGSDEAFLDHFVVQGNIAFDNGIVSRSGITRNILLGGGVIAYDNAILDNYTYFSPSALIGQNNVGYRAGCSGVTIKRNYFANGGLVMIDCQSYTIEENVFHPYIFGFPVEQLPSNAYLRTRPSGTRIFMRPNQYETGRAHIAIFNWDRLACVPVDLSSLLKAGTPFQVRDLQNLPGEPLFNDIYSGEPICIPMDTTSTAPFVGQPGVPLRHTSAEFGAFVVLPYSAPIAGRRAEPPRIRRNPRSQERFGNRIPRNPDPKNQG